MICERGTPCVGGDFFPWREACWGGCKHCVDGPRMSIRKKMAALNPPDGEFR